MQQGEAFDTFTGVLSDYHQGKQIKLPDMVPTSAGGHNKTSEWGVPEQSSS